MRNVRSGLLREIFKWLSQVCRDLNTLQGDSCVREGSKDQEDEADADDESPRPLGRLPPRHHGGRAGKGFLLGGRLLREDWTGGPQRHSRPHLAGQPRPPTVGRTNSVWQLNIFIFNYLSVGRLSLSSVETWSQFSGERRLEVFTWLVVLTISGGEKLF